MKYKALIVDLDGTTVPAFTHEVHDRVKKAIHLAHDKLFISVATGRPLELVKSIIDQIDLTGICVLCNGAQLYDPVRKEIIYENSLTQEETELIFEQIKDLQDKFVVFNGFQDKPAVDRQKFPKILNYYAQDLERKYIEEVEQRMKQFPHLATVRLLGTVPEKQSIEITQANSTKQFGIFEVAKMKNIQTHEIIGIGDGYNDFPLLMACGLKVAMGNAVPELKEIADFVIPSVDKDGVAVFIEKFILDL